MNWCQRRSDPNAKCGHDEDKPLACHHSDSGRLPDHEGIFDFVRFKGIAGRVAEHSEIVSKLYLHFDESVPHDVRERVVADIKEELSKKDSTS